MNQLEFSKRIISYLSRQKKYWNDRKDTSICPYDLNITFPYSGMCYGHVLMNFFRAYNCTDKKTQELIRTRKFMERHLDIVDPTDKVNFQILDYIRTLLKYQENQSSNQQLKEILNQSGAYYSNGAYNIKLLEKKLRYLYKLSRVTKMKLNIEISSSYNDRPRHSVGVIIDGKSSPFFSEVYFFDSNTSLDPIKAPWNSKLGEYIWDATDPRYFFTDIKGDIMKKFRFLEFNILSSAELIYKINPIKLNINGKETIEAIEKENLTHVEKENTISSVTLFTNILDDIEESEDILYDTDNLRKRINDVLEETSISKSTKTFIEKYLNDNYQL